MHICQLCCEDQLCKYREEEKRESSAVLVAVNEAVKDGIWREQNRFVWLLLKALLSVCCVQRLEGRA